MMIVRRVYSTFISTILAACCLPHHAVFSQTTYNCPGLSANPVVVAAGNGSTFTRQINKSASETVCVLVWITPRSDNANMNTIERNSKNEDYYIVPVARSYNNNNWERVAGPYAQDLSISNCCSLAIPKLPNLASEGKLILMSYTHSVSNKEEVSRFLQQTTFGPTLDMINGWNYGMDMTSGMGSWLKSQMDENQTPITSHRAYFRERANFPMLNSFASAFGRPRHPCAKYARWRQYAFTAADYQSQVSVTRWNGQFILSIDGNPRTVVSNWKDAEGNDLDVDIYEFCWHTEGKVGGDVRLYDIRTFVCHVIPNPPVNLPISIQPSNFTQVTLPIKSNFETVDAVSAQLAYGLLYGEDLLAKTRFFTNGCSSIGNDGIYANVIGTFSDGSQAVYAAHAELDENTLSNPIADGGYAMMQADNSLSLTYLWAHKPYCPVAARSFVNSDTCYLSKSSDKACNARFIRFNGKDTRSLICGSPGEVANNPLKQNVFAFGFPKSHNTGFPSKQKSDVWNMIALESSDQLRQRMAWALSQILVITSSQIEEEDMTEMYLSYYDIFTRHAFGNFFDILKEVSYSPMMADMLSYLDSKSSAYILEETGSKSYPDENYAREVMQLFTIGLYKLNEDGTEQVDSSGSKILSYDNTDIQNFARAWTGFTTKRKRSNIEAQSLGREQNRIDPMDVNGLHRDPFPKSDLVGGFIGDKVPLCVNLPVEHFLAKGATYRLLGSSLHQELHSNSLFREDGILLLDPSSSLRSHLLNKEPIVTLDTDIQCTGVECEVDSLITVKIESNPPIYYEYQREPCVELSFYDNPSKISRVTSSMCADPKVNAAHDTCCESLERWSDWGSEVTCRYDSERTTLSTARTRCRTKYADGDLCDAYYIYASETCKTPWSLPQDLQDDWYWTGESCTLKAKINEDGHVAIAHVPNLLTDHPDPERVDKIDLRVHPDNTNYFKVVWDSNNHPKPSNSCANSACSSVNRGCLCDVNVVETPVFSSLPSENAIIEKLHIGSVEPSRLGVYTQVSNTGTVKVWHKNGGYDIDTIFRIKYRGKQIFVKNVRSVVQIAKAPQYEFRNPPSFVNLGFREIRDAMYETDAVLENYFYHDNVGPFLALRLIQRFGISNPSPQYINRVASAFKDGIYLNPHSGSGNFGDGRYGNLEAMVAAIILDTEARSVVLDVDPTSGSLVEPMIKLTRLMRSMKFETNARSGDRVRLIDLGQAIGQEVYNAPNVFNFFHPEYSAPGHISAASIVSPEAQILTGTKVISQLNGFISLVDLGLNNCYSGFGIRTGSPYLCSLLASESLASESYYNNDDEYNLGKLEYSPSNPNNPVAVVDELSLLLTGGRLNSRSKLIIASAYQEEENNDDGLRLAQKLILHTPEFHTTSTSDVTSTARPDLASPESSNQRYKAVVYVYLDGGSDSHNMLVPYDGCNGGKTSYNHYADVRGNIAIPKGDLLPIDVSGSAQVCNTFGVHPNLEHLKALYDSGDLLWVANMGVLQEYCTVDDWWKKSDSTVLFAHNIQNDEVQNMDIYDQQIGRGVGGRMADLLTKSGFSAAAVSLFGAADALVSNRVQTFILDSWRGMADLNPSEWAQPIWDRVKQLNAASNLGSNVFGETWSNSLFQVVGENEMLQDKIENTTLSTEFDFEFGGQLEIVSKLIKTQKSRGVDRDIFYVSLGGFDTHDNIKENLDLLTTTMNGGLKSFTTEMKAQGAWNDVTVVMVSEFARTLPGNTGAGSDHAWGGNYFIAGGEVKGKQILGSYPDILSEDGPLIFAPGIVIPTLPWDSLWNGVAQWFGITSSDDLDEVLPNRNKFVSDLFDESDLYTTGSQTPSPVTVTTSAPTPSKLSNAPSSPSGSCADFGGRIRFEIDPGTMSSKSCEWAGRKSTTLRCAYTGVSEACPVTCGSCSTCADPADLRFRFDNNGSMLSRSCVWVARKKTASRCILTDNICRATCGVC